MKELEDEIEAYYKKYKEPLTLETYLRNQMNKFESMADYSVATDTVRCYIDIFNEYHKSIEIKALTPLTPQEIKDELIKMGWEVQEDGTLEIILDKINIVYYELFNELDLYTLIGESLCRIKSPTLDRIKALIFALTGETL